MRWNEGSRYRGGRGFARLLNRGRNHAAALLLAMALLVASASGALACTCSGLSSPDLAVMITEVAFRGRVVATEEVGTGPHARQRVQFEIDRLWKGLLPRRTAILAGGMGSLCGVRFRVGQEATVFASRVNGDVTPNSCSMFLARGAEPGLRRMEEEVERAETAVRASPGMVPPLLAQADLLRRWRDHERALALYRDVVRIAPGSIEAQASIALSLVATRRPDEAIAVLDAVQARLGPHGELQRLARLARIVSGQPWDGGPLDFRGADISRLDWSGRSLPGIDFTGAFLMGIQFERSRMPGARFDQASLYGVGFDHADLAQARFDGAQLAHVNMRNANLRQARFHDVEFVRLDPQVTAVMMDGADLREALIVRAAGFPSVSGANMQGARLEQVSVTRQLVFQKTDLRGAEILESRFDGAFFLGATLDRARFSMVHMRSGVLAGTSVEAAVFRNVTFDDVRFSPVDDYSQQAPLRAADLRGARLINVRVQPPP